MFLEKYQPITSKSLFHKNIVETIKKWLKSIVDLSEYNKSVQKILFLHGPVGCGKSVTINILLKNYNINNIEPSDIRSNEKINDITSSLSNFNDMTLSNIDKWNKKNVKIKSENNIILIDNIELCEKNIETFVETVHKKKNVNIPLILICNNPKLKDIFVSNPDCTYIEFGKPLENELIDLITDINIKECLRLRNEYIKTIIELSQYDIRQVLYILEQWKTSNHNFNEFITNIVVKHTDIDLTNKLLYLFDGRKLHDTNYTFDLASTEPIVVSYNFFQNYLDVLQYKQKEFDTKKENDTKKEKYNLEALIASSNICESISYSNTIGNKIFDEQYWDLYNIYTMTSCVIPSYHIKETCCIDNIEQELYNNIVPFKDISYNFINSFNEVKRICTENNLSNKTIHINNNPIKFTDISNDFCYLLAKMFLFGIGELNIYFDKNKKGKNTSKNEKILLCNSIKTGKIKDIFDDVLDKIYSYKLFEVDMTDIIMNRKKYINDECYINNVNKIDLRMLKRLINIFSFVETNRFIKSHVEMAIKYKLLQRLINDINEQHKNNNNIYDVNNLVCELDDIWNLK